MPTHTPCTYHSVTHLQIPDCVKMSLKNPFWHHAVCVCVCACVQCLLLMSGKIYRGPASPLVLEVGRRRCCHLRHLHLRSVLSAVPRFGSSVKNRARRETLTKRAPG